MLRSSLEQEQLRQEEVLVKSPPLHLNQSVPFVNGKHAKSPLNSAYSALVHMGMEKKMIVIQ